MKLFLPVFLCLFFYGTLPVAAGEVVYISKEELRDRISSSANLVILDVRSEYDWLSSPAKIKGAVRNSPSQLNNWADKYLKDTPLVLYCA